MTRLKTIGAIGALLLGSSTLALAQTTPPVAPPQGGSHPVTAAPQSAPDSWAMQPSSGVVTTPPAVVPGSAVPGSTVSTVRAPAPQVASADIDWLVRKRIEAAGYSSPNSVTPSVDGYSARAMESGQRVTVDVNGSGNVYRVPNQH